MADNKISRLSRLISILTHLQTKRLLTATEISKTFNVSIRTVYRDIRTLEEAGIPICVEEGKGYSLLEGYRLAPVTFSESEANALITAEQLILRNKDASLVRNYTEAIGKIKSVLQYNTKDKVNMLSQRIVFRQNTENDKTSNYLSAVQLAITNLSLTKIEYQSPDKNETTLRSIEPFALYSTQENWILIAWCRLRKDYRAFRLDRIKRMEILHDTFDKQKISLQEYFKICKEKYFLNP